MCKVQVIEKSEGNPDRVEVETSQLIFKVSDENQTELKHFITMFCFLTQVKQLKITPKYSLNKWTSPGHLHQRRGTGDDSYAHPWFFARGLKICYYTNICFPLFHYPMTNPNKDNSNLYIVHRSNLIHSPFQPVKLFVSKETILKLLNIDFMKVNADDIYINIEYLKSRAYMIFVIFSPRTTFWP